MRIVVCDRDGVLRESVEALVAKTGHQLVGVASTTADGVGLIDTARPDAVVFDVAIGYGTDFDVIEAAQAIGATVVIFSYSVDDSLLARYSIRPIVVHKPDLVVLEAALSRLELEGERAVEVERRQREMRDLPVPPATGPTDAAAFYEALNEAIPGDTLVSVESDTDAELVAERVTEVLRSADRLVATAYTVRVLLIAGGVEGRDSFLDRLRLVSALPSDAVVRSVVVQEGETPLDAFDRLKTGGELHPVDPAG